MTEPLVPLDALGERFRRLGEPPAPRRNPVPRALAIGVVLALLLAGVAAAAILIIRGAPLPAPNAQDLSSSGVPTPASARLAGLDAPDPDPSAPSWDIRISRTRAGETCTAVGQVLDGQFGIVGLDHVFRALPLGGVDACGVASPGGPLLAGARVFLGDANSEARTVVNGIAGVDARSVTAYGPDGPRRLELGTDGSFITVYRGYVEDVRPRIVVVTRDGHSHTIAFASSTAFEVADPDGGSPWQASGDPALQPGSYPDEDCAQASQELGRTDPSHFGASLTPEVCGRLGQQPLFVSMRRFVPGSGEGTGFPWGNNPARTLVYGAASLRVLSLTLSGAGAPRLLPIDVHGGVFLAVLDGHVDPHSLMLTARLRDGQVISYKRSTDLLDESMRPAFNDAPAKRPLSESDDPAYREPLPASKTELPTISIPISGTVRETLHASDPAGGPEWALRSWRGLPNPRANFGGGYHPSRFVCLQVGAREGGRLLELRPGLAPLSLEVGREGGADVGGCNEPAYIAKHGPMMQVVSYTGHPYAYAPTPMRTVVSGLLPADASHPLLLGAGSPRVLRTDANHAFLVVLPGRYWDAPLRVSVSEHGRTIEPSAASTLSVPPTLTVPQARAPDPDGGAPWGFSATAGGAAYGRIVDGRLAYVSGRYGTVTNGPMGSSSGGSCTARRSSRACPFADRRPPAVEFDAQSEPEEGFIESAVSTLTPPQIERRTLEGETIITARAEPDVVSVTLATPRDVRTLRPAGPRHVFIVVYDGQFFRGAITATILLRDGRTVTQSVLTGAGVGGTTPEPPSLATQLHDVLAQISGIQQRGRQIPARHAEDRELREMADTIERRIAYESSHPGLLPES